MGVRIDRSAHTAVTRLEDRLRGIPEPAMRRALILEWILREPPDDLWPALAHVFHRAPETDSCFDLLLEDLHAVLREPARSDGLPEDLRFSLYARAVDADLHAMVRALSPSVSVRTVEDPASGLPREIAEIPLGRRRSLAKSFDRRMLARLARDPDPMVIRNLLQNPRLREADVLELATRRPAAASSLEAIGRETRWCCRTAVRTALARNPYTPVAVALQMLNGVSRQELAEIRTDGTLHPEVRSAASRMLAERAGPR